MNKIKLSLRFFLISIVLKAQVIAPKVKILMDNEIKKLWPLGLGIIVMIGFGPSIKLFFGENKDIEKGFTRMFTVMAGITLSGVIIAWVLKLGID